MRDHSIYHERIELVKAGRLVEILYRRIIAAFVQTSSDIDRSAHSRKK